VSSGPPVLWQYSFSNYNEKVRWALDYKRIPHRRRSVLPGGPRGLRFSRGDGTLPILDLDGRRIADSTAIIAALEERQPEPPLYPADQDERRHALELEDYFDEHAGHDMRRVGFWEARDKIRYGTAFLTTDQPRALRRALGLTGRLVKPAFWWVADRRYGFSQEAYGQSCKALAAALDRIEEGRGGRDYLVGESFTVADLTPAALLYPLVWPPQFQYELPDPPRSEFAESVKEHSALEWIREMWRRHRGRSAAI
jgi:glutathione S-transferase